MIMFEQKFSNKAFAGSGHQFKKKTCNNTEVMLIRLNLVYSEGLLACDLQTIYPDKGNISRTYKEFLQFNKIILNGHFYKRYKNGQVAPKRFSKSSAISEIQNHNEIPLHIDQDGFNQHGTTTLKKQSRGAWVARSVE